MNIPGPHTEILVISTGCAVGCLLLTSPQSQWHCGTHDSVWRTELHFQDRKSSSVYQAGLPEGPQAWGFGLGINVLLPNPDGTLLLGVHVWTPKAHKIPLRDHKPMLLGKEQ